MCIDHRRRELTRKKRTKKRGIRNLAGKIFFIWSFLRFRHFHLFIVRMFILLQLIFRQIFEFSNSIFIELFCRHTDNHLYINNHISVIFFEFVLFSTPLYKTRLFFYKFAFSNCFHERTAKLLDSSIRCKIWSSKKFIK